MPTLNKAEIKVNPKISVGFGTISGMLLALAQYLGAIGLMLAGDLTTESIGTMATATATLVTVLVGRFKQADSAIKSISAERAANPSFTASPGVLLERSVQEPNVLYLDGNAIAEAVVKSINTKAVLANMTGRTGQTQTAETMTPASAPKPASTEEAK